MPEQPLEPHRHAHVRQRVATEVDERAVVGDVVAAENVRVQRPQPPGVHGPRLGRRLRRFRGGAERGDGAVVRFAVGGAGQLGHHAHPHRGLGQPARAGRDRPHGRGVGSLDGDDQFVVAAGAARDELVAREDGFDALQVDAQAEQLREAGATAHDPVQPGVGADGEVTGAQFVDDTPEGQLGRVGGIAEHDVGPGVDEFAGTVAGLGHGVDAEGAAGNGDADRAGVLRGEVRGQVGHAGGGLGLAVHDEELPPVAPAEVDIAADAVGVETAAGLGDVAQVRQVHVGEADAVEQVEGVRHAREGADPVPVHEVPESGVGDGPVGEHGPGAPQQVAVQDRQTVAVVHRQGGDRAVGVADVEVVGDGLGVRLHIAVREAHELGRAGRAGRTEQQREVGMQVVGAVGEFFDPAAVDDDVGPVGLDRRGQGVGPVAGHEQHGMAGGQRRQVGHDRVDGVGPGDQDETPGGAEAVGDGGDPLGQVAIGDLGAVADECGPFAVFGEMSDERNRRTVDELGRTWYHRGSL
ncbi:hypothetical protein AIIKEEIJ_01766 [Rhodococcus sp. YH1]|nr:hypothetical protein [Rhodococcus sp. YH1]